MSEFVTIGEPISLFGSNDLDESLENAKNFTKYLAGAEVNVTVGVSRLGHETEYLTRLGNDPFGEFIINELNNNNIGTNFIDQTDKFWTAFQLKNQVSVGDPDIFYYRKGSAASHFNKEKLDEIDFSKTKLVHLSGIFPAISQNALESFEYLIDLIEKHDIISTFDPNLRPQLWNSENQMKKRINKLAQRANIIMPGINEGKILVGSEDPEIICDFYLNSSEKTNTVIVKLGSKGAYIKTKNDDSGKHIKGYNVENVVDTVGAGDGFAVGVITGILEDLKIEEAVNRGNAIGALAVQSLGDNDGYPYRKTLEKFMN